MRKTIYTTLIVITCFACSEKSNPWKEISPELESFIISSKNDTLIEGSQGTLVYIPANSFLNGNEVLVDDSITITLEEVYSKADMILSPLSTITSDGQTLETAGMINLSASIGSEALHLDPSKRIVVHFPKKNEETKMNLFYGVKSETGTVEWKIEEEATYGIVESISPWYTKYDSVDNPHLRLSDSTNWSRVLPGLFSLSDLDIDELVNKTVDVNYTITSQGKLNYKNVTGSKISTRLKKKLVKVTKEFPRCLPYRVNGVPIDMPGFFKIYAKVIPPKFESNEDYINQLENKFGSGEALDLAEVQYYIFDSKQLGWMNCDKFISTGADLITYKVKVQKSNDPFVKIVFDNFNSVMTGDQRNKTFIFDNVAEGEPIKLVVIDHKEGIPYITILDTLVTKELVKTETNEVKSLNDIKKALAEFE